MYAKKNSGKKVLAIALAVVLLIGIGVGGTLAWLSATSGTVTNTFTVGNITIELKEHELGEDGKLGDKEVTENQNYKIVPGATQPKDPFVTVKSGSEKCHVYVSIENELGANLTYDINGTDWIKVGEDATNNKVVYRYKDVIDASNADVPKTVFNNVTYSTDITETTITALTGKKVTINAYAHQSENITDVTVVDAAACAHFTVTAVTP